MTDQEINKAIAEKVMGYDVLETYKSGKNLITVSPETTKKFSHLEKVTYIRDGYSLVKIVPDYCTDLNAAFEAWRKFEPTLGDGGYRTGFDGAGNVTVIIYRYFSPCETPICKDPSPAKALCLALLAALEAGKK